jgi:hypothetical protein
MMMKTSELIDQALDWAVEVACVVGRVPNKEQAVSIASSRNKAFRVGYSTNWAAGGPIIEREEIGIMRNAPCSDGMQWEARPSITARGAGGKWAYGPTPLIAAMRCFVASKLGDEVDVPQELT